jgi:hypothetical protein
LNRHLPCRSPHPHFHPHPPNIRIPHFIIWPLTAQSSENAIASARLGAASRSMWINVGTARSRNWGATAKKQENVSDTSGWIEDSVAVSLQGSRHMKYVSKLAVLSIAKASRISRCDESSSLNAIRRTFAIPHRPSHQWFGRSTRASVIHE